MSCISENIYGFDVKVCDDGNGAYHAVGSFEGFDLQTVEFKPTGDMSVALFSIPGLGGLGTKIELQVLRQDRSDGSDFAHKGDVRGRYWQWNAAHSLQCVIPKTGDLESHCWEAFSGSDHWKRLGRL